MTEPERLVGCAIVREGKTHPNPEGLRFGPTSHYEVRAGLRDADPARSCPTDIEGFLTSAGRFVTREEAIPIGVAAGQLHPRWAGARGRKLLSSDLNW